MFREDVVKEMMDMNSWRNDELMDIKQRSTISITMVVKERRSLVRNKQLNAGKTKS